MPVATGYLLDTNILVHLLRGDALGKYIDQTYSLRSTLSHCVISVVTVGETGSLARAWNYAHVLRDDGLSYMAYTEQITFLLFLKMADELTKPPYNRPALVPPSLGWELVAATARLCIMNLYLHGIDADPCSSCESPYSSRAFRSSVPTLMEA